MKQGTYTWIQWEDMPLFLCPPWKDGENSQQVTEQLIRNLPHPGDRATPDFSSYPATYRRRPRSWQVTSKCHWLNGSSSHNQRFCHSIEKSSQHNLDQAEKQKCVYVRLCPACTPPPISGGQEGLRDGRREGRKKEKKQAVE